MSQRLKSTIVIYGCFNALSVFTIKKSQQFKADWKLFLTFLIGKNFAMVSKDLFNFLCELKWKSGGEGKIN